MSKNITMQDLKDREITVFSTIPGMNELLQASPAQKAEVEARYPEAVFAIVIASSLFNHNRELSEITQKAYFSILNGENIANVRFATIRPRMNTGKDICGMTKTNLWGTDLSRLLSIFSIGIAINSSYRNHLNIDKT